MAVNDLIIFRKGTSEQWNSANPILASGEPGYDLTNEILKIGDGISNWSGLPPVGVGLNNLVEDLSPQLGGDLDLNSYNIINSGNININGNITCDYVYSDLSGTIISANSGNFLDSLKLNGTNVSVSGHTHTSSNITDFNTSVSGLLPIISNSGDNRLLTSIGSTVGINAENNLTFDGSLLSIGGNFVVNTGTINQIVFNTSLADPNLLQGQLQWNATEGTLDLGVNENYAMHLGEEMLYRIRNTTGMTLRAGQPVYASGLSPGANNRIEVNLYVADGSVREVQFMGLITEDVSDNGTNGYATQFGFIRKVDTRGNATTNGTTNKLWTTGEPEWYEGDILYVHPTVAGKLTKIEPKHSISVAIITSKGTNGKIFVRSTSYGHLSDNHDVDTSGATNGQFLQYNSSTDYWLPSSSGNFTNLQVNGTGVSLNGHTHSSSDITNFNSSVSGLVSGIYAPLTGTLNQFSNTTSSQLISIISDETGSGLLVFNNSPTFTGTPLVPTANSGTNTNQIASTSFVRTEISNLVNSAPSTLDTLNELASALGNDANFSTTITNSLASKANLSGSTFTGAISGPSGDFTVLKQNGSIVSVTGHTHISSNITDFNSSVSGLLPTIANNGDNRILTSTGSTVGINAESNLTFDGTNLTAPYLVSSNSSGDEGGEIQLAKPPNGTLSGGITIDAYQNRLRFFEQGGSARGFYLDLSSAGAGASTNLAAGGGSATSVSNYADNRVITSDGTTTGLNAESNFTFNGSLLTSPSGNFINSLQVNSINVSISGHNHSSSDITNFNSSVSGLLPVTNIVAGTGMMVSSSSGSFTINLDAYSVLIGDGSATSYTVTHNLGATNDVHVSVRETGTNYYVYPDIKYVNTNSVLIEFVSAPTSNQYRVSIIGF
jgi:hypothetical protein